MKITFIKYLFIRNSMFFLQKISLKVLLGYVDILNGVVIMIRSNGAHTFFFAGTGAHTFHQHLYHI